MKNNSQENRKKILVIGSSNTDMVIQSPHLPRPGETVVGGTFFMNPGGKGANQAVAAARLGGSVRLICKTGNDIFGHQSQQLFEEEDIDTSYILSDNNFPSGVALIFVDNKAENCIAVAPGANGSLSPVDIQASEKAIDESDVVLMQLEIPIETVCFTAQLASEKGKMVILNPAPAPAPGVLTRELLQHIYLIIPNETEAEIISGISVNDYPSAVAAARKIIGMGANNVIITLGSKGALLCNAESEELIPAIPVKAVDTTAAGDCFCGALTQAIAEGRALIDAVKFAAKAAAISVTRHGAQSSAPYRAEVDVF
ncbi:ribokinase [Phocaeicola coprocola]|uniref:ribokinase n=1 Tax=Phocaeicola coprocola TaxID=310298 RepID=UPI0026707D61|nr:ribokinase [Phocaeicola coprocola]